MSSKSSPFFNVASGGVALFIRNSDLPAGFVWLQSPQFLIHGLRVGSFDGSFKFFKGFIGVDKPVKLRVFGDLFGLKLDGGSGNNSSGKQLWWGESKYRMMVPWWMVFGPCREAPL